MTRLTSASIILLTLLLLGQAVFACTASTNQTVVICSPANGSTVTSPVAFSAAAASSNTVTAMAIYADGTKVASSTSASISASVSLAAGSHAITIKAWDSAGAIFSSKETITVGSSTGTGNPTVTINSPANGASVTSPVSFSASASDTNPVTAMAIYADGTKVASSTSASISASVPLAIGSHAITIKAWDSTNAVFYTKETISVSGSTSTVSLSASPARIKPGSASTLTVTANQVTNVVVSDNVDSNKVTLSDSGGTLSVSPSKSAEYTVTATGSDGKSRTSSVWIIVTDTTNFAGAIQHIVFSLQENRSFDNYFGRLAAYQRLKGMTPDVDELPLSVELTDKAGNWIKPYHQATVCTESVTPAWGASHVAWDNGLNDKFLHVVDNSTIDPNGSRPMGYYDWTDLPYYYEVATQFATSDRYFSSLLSRTPPNRMYLLGASSYGNIYTGSIPSTAPTIFDRLAAKGISWKYYYIPGAFIQLQNWHTYSTDSSKVRPISEYFTDLTNGTLPQVAFIERTGSLDEHPNSNIQKGAHDMKSDIDAFMQSQYWKDSVFILAYDEGGGMYDHVPPIKVPAPDDIPPKLSSTDKPGDFTVSGFRVPLMVMSPYVKPHYVSHVPRETTSILKFIEARFGLQPLTRRDEWADDMTEMFDFNTPHLLTPPTLPSQPTTKTCSNSLEKSPQEP